MFKAFKYRLYPSRSQERLLEQTLERCRRWYNTCLEERKTAWEKRRWEKRRQSIGKYDQLRQVKDLKDTNPYAQKVYNCGRRSLGGHQALHRESEERLNGSR